MALQISCPFPNCDFIIQAGTPPDCCSTLLKIHLTYHESTISHNKAEKIKRPAIASNATAEDWRYFTARWQLYKNATKLTGEDINIQLLECLDEHLRKNLNRVHSSTVMDMTESKLMSSIKTLAVIDESVLVCRYKLHNLKLL